MIVALVLMACGGSGADAVATALYPEGARREEAARNALAEIRQREESYRAEFGCYSNVTPNQEWLPAIAPPPDGIAPWTPTEATQRLGYEPDRPNVAWQIQVVAGVPGTQPPGSPAALEDFWYIARARGHFRTADRLDVLEQRSDAREPVLLGP